MTASSVNDPGRLIADLDFVRGLARQLCGDANRADDISQEAMVAAIERPPPRSLNWRGWLATVVRNLVRNQIRSDARRAGRELRVGVREVPTPADIAESEQLRATVVREVLQLPGAYRETVLLRYYRGLETRAIAAELAISEGTVRSRLKRGIDRLRVRLDAEQGGRREVWVRALLPLAWSHGEAAAAVGVGSTRLVSGKNALAIAASVVVAAALGLLVSSELESSDAPSVATGASAELGPSTSVVANTDNESIRRDSLSARSSSGQDDASSSAWRIRGVVRSEATGLPIADAVVRAFGENEFVSHELARIEFDEVRTDDLGQYEVSLEKLQKRTALSRSMLLFEVRVDARDHQPVSETAKLREMLDGLLTIDVEVAPAILTKGRVVSSDGLPVPDATIVFLPQNDAFAKTTERDGSFALAAYDENVGMCKAIACHPEHGISSPVIVRWNARGDTLLGDLELNRSLGVIEGVVRFPSGEPAAGVEVYVWRDLDGGEDLHESTADAAKFGVPTDVYEALWFEHGGEAFEVRSAADGTFTIRVARPGRHMVSIDSGEDEALEVVVGSRPSRVELTCGRAQVHVRIEDLDGHLLPAAYFNARAWRGEDAVRASRRFAARGVDDEFLQSGDSLQHGQLQDDLLLWCEPETFLLVEASSDRAGVGYAACLLDSGEHRADLRIALRERTRTGSLLVEARTDGGQLLNNTLFKVCRHRVGQSVPILFLDRLTIADRYRDVMGPWQVLPADGEIRGLPSGQLTIEVLPGVERMGMSHSRFPFAIQSHRVDIVAAAQARLQIEAQRGVLVRFDLRAPMLGANERMAMSHGNVLIFDDRGKRHHIELCPVGDPDRFEFENGRCAVQLSEALPPGTHNVKLLDFGSVETLDLETGRWNDSNHRIEQPAPMALTVAAGMSAVPVSLMRARIR